MKETVPVGGAAPERTPLIEVAGKKLARKLAKHRTAPGSTEKKPALETKDKKAAAKELGKTKAETLGIIKTTKTVGSFIALALLGSVMLTDQAIELLASLDKDFQKGWHSGKLVFGRSNKRGKEK